MSRKDSAKYVLEARSLLVNLKIASGEFEKDTHSEVRQEVLAELYNKLDEVSLLYGINSVSEYSLKILELLKFIPIPTKRLGNRSSL